MDQNGGSTKNFGTEKKDSIKISDEEIENSLSFFIALSKIKNNISWKSKEPLNKVSFKSIGSKHSKLSSTIKTEYNFYSSFSTTTVIADDNIALFHKNNTDNLQKKNVSLTSNSNEEKEYLKTYLLKRRLSANLIGKSIINEEEFFNN